MSQACFNASPVGHTRREAVHDSTSTDRASVPDFTHMLTTSSGVTSASSHEP